MIHLFTSDQTGRPVKLAAALVDRLRDGEAVMEIQPAGVARLELDGFGGIRRVDVGRPTSDQAGSSSVTRSSARKPTARRARTA